MRREEVFRRLTLPGKVMVLEGFIFRRSEPAIFGVKVLAGRIKPKYVLMNGNGVRIGRIHQIQERKQSLNEATKNMEVAISVKEAVYGRDFREKDILYVDIPERDYLKLKEEFLDELLDEERKLLEEIAKIKREINVMWGFK